MSPFHGIGIIPGACTDVAKGVNPGVSTSVASGLSPGLATNGASEFILAQIPSAQPNTQPTILLPTPRGVESPRPPGPEPRPGGRGEPRPGGREPRELESLTFHGMGVLRVRPIA